MQSADIPVRNDERIGDKKLRYYKTLVVLLLYIPFQQIQCSYKHPLSVWLSVMMMMMTTKTTTMILSRVWGTLDGLGMIIGFIEHLQIVTISYYSAIARTHRLQFTRARTKSSQFAVSSPIVAWWRNPVMSSVSVLTFLPASDCLTTNSLL
jgi:hypothetical protein